MKTTTKDGFARLEKRILREVARAVKKSAFALEAVAKMKTPVDTGALKSSIYTVTAGSSNYPKAEEAVKAKRTDAEILDETLPPEHGLEAVVVVGVAYGKHVEYGTHKMSAQPFMRPAAAQIQPLFERNVAAAVEKAVGG